MGGPIQPRLRRSHGNVEHGGDFFDREVQEEIQREDQALAVAQPGQRPAQVDPPRHVLLGRYATVRRIWQRKDPPPVSAPDRATVVSDDGQEPGTQVAAFPDRMPLLPRFQRCLLHRVLGSVPIAQNRERQSVTGLHQLAQQRIQRLPGLCCLGRQCDRAASSVHRPSPEPTPLGRLSSRSSFSDEGTAHAIYGVWYDNQVEKTTLYLPGELHRAIRAASARTGKPMAQLVREALQGYLSEQPPPQPRSLGMGADTELAARDSESWLEREWGGSPARG